MDTGLQTAVTALDAFQSDLDAIGGNLANVNTAGYKTNQVNFQTLVGQTLSYGSGPGTNTGSINPQQLGQGVGIASTAGLFTQGTLQVTNNPTDLALQGNGFFVLQQADGTTPAYTRNGAFSLDASGTLVNANGLDVLGYPASNGTVTTSGALQPLKIPTGAVLAATPTTTMSMSGNLDATTVSGGTETSQAVVYDSQGNADTVNYTFTAGATPNNWTWTATVNGAAAGTGTLVFNPNGTVNTTSSSATPTVAFTPTGGASPVSVAVNFSNVTQLAAPGNSAIVAQTQNGSAAGTMQNFSIGQDGTITANFSNGATQVLGQVAVATFNNNQGLLAGPGGTYTSTAASGQPVTDPTSQQGSAGQIVAGSLESSNVDISTEFTNMIVAQRAFEANSKMVSTIDSVLQTMMQMKQ